MPLDRTLWYWTGSDNVETALDVYTRGRFSVVNMKALDGTFIMGGSIPQLVAVASAFEMPVALWSVLHGGLEWAGELALTEAIIQAFDAANIGISAWYLDAEPYAGYWHGDPSQPASIRPILYANGIPIYATIDPRVIGNPSMDAFCEAADFIAPMCYWTTFETDMDALVMGAFSQFEHFGKPIRPVFPGDATAYDLEQAIRIAPRFGVWRAGTVSQAALSALESTGMIQENQQETVQDAAIAHLEESETTLEEEHATFLKNNTAFVNAVIVPLVEQRFDVARANLNYIYALAGLPIPAPDEQSITPPPTPPAGP